MIWISTVPEAGDVNVWARQALAAVMRAHDSRYCADKRECNNDRNTYRQMPHDTRDVS